MLRRVKRSTLCWWTLLWCCLLAYCCCTFTRRMPCIDSCRSESRWCPRRIDAMWARKSACQQSREKLCAKRIGRRNYSIWKIKFAFSFYLLFSSLIFFVENYLFLFIDLLIFKKMLDSKSGLLELASEQDVLISQGSVARRSHHIPNIWYFVLIV